MINETTKTKNTPLLCNVLRSGETLKSMKYDILLHLVTHRERHVLGPSNFKIKLHIFWLRGGVNTLQLLQCFVKDLRGQFCEFSLLESDEVVKRDIVISEKHVDPSSNHSLA